MFAFFDTDGSGTLDINEYMHASSVHEDTPKDKVRLDAVQCMGLAEGLIVHLGV